MVAGTRMSAVKEVRSRWVLNIGIQGRANIFFWWIVYGCDRKKGVRNYSQEFSPELLEEWSAINDRESLWQYQVWSDRGDLISFGQAKFEMPIKHLSGDIEAEVE